MHGSREFPVSVVQKILSTATRKALAHPLHIRRARLIGFGSHKSIELVRSQSMRCLCEFVVFLPESAYPFDKAIGASVVAVVEARFKPDLAIRGQHNPLCCQG